MSPGLFWMRAGRLAAALAAAGLAATACGPANPVASGAVPAATAPATPQAAHRPARPAAPLTGAPAASASAAARPAVAVVVAGHNPRGLADADVVFQEMTTPERFIAVYQSRSASTVGPVTSTQPTDREALAVLHPLLAYAGAPAQFFISMLDKSTVTDVGHRTHRTLYRTTASGLTTSTREIAKAAHGDTAPPPLFQYGKAGRLAGRQRAARSARLVIPGNGTQEWAFRKSADRWVLTRGGPRVQVANLAIEWVPYRQLGVGAHAKAKVSSAQVVGKGKTEVLSGGRSGSSTGTVAVGVWSKPLSRALTSFFDASFAPMTFQPGPTWVVFAPPGTRVRTSR